MASVKHCRTPLQASLYRSNSLTEVVAYVLCQVMLKWSIAQKNLYSDCRLPNPRKRLFLRAAHASSTLITGSSKRYLPCKLCSAFCTTVADAMVCFWEREILYLVGGVLTMPLFARSHVKSRSEKRSSPLRAPLISTFVRSVQMLSLPDCNVLPILMQTPVFIPKFYFSNITPPPRFWFHINF